MFAIDIPYEEEILEEGPIRVTKILAPFSGYGSLPAENVKKASIRGDKVHKIIQAYLMGLGLWGVDETTKPYIDSFLQWWTFQYPIISLEQRFDDKLLNITGKPDSIVKTNIGNVLLDWKTSENENPIWDLQGSAYEHIVNLHGYDIQEMWFIKLRKNGKAPKIKKCERKFKDFLMCLDMHHKYFKNQKYICTEDL